MWKGVLAPVSAHMGTSGPRVELESQKVSETSLRHHVSTLTETGLRNLILFLPRLVSETFFSSITETSLGNLFSTLLRLVSETFFSSPNETGLRNFFSTLLRQVSTTFFYL